MSLVHIYRPTGHYIGQVRDYGCRNWKTVTGKHASMYIAMARAVMRMEQAHRGRVLLIVESGYYEPTVVMECKK